MIVQVDDFSQEVNEAGKEESEVGKGGWEERQEEGKKEEIIVKKEEGMERERGKEREGRKWREDVYIQVQKRRREGRKKIMKKRNRREKMEAQE